MSGVFFFSGLVQNTFLCHWRHLLHPVTNISANWTHNWKVQILIKTPDPYIFFRKWTSWHSYYSYFLNLLLILLSLNTAPTDDATCNQLFLVQPGNKFSSLEPIFQFWSCRIFQNKAQEPKLALCWAGAKALQRQAHAHTHGRIRITN